MNILNIGHNVNGQPCHTAASIAAAFERTGMRLASLHVHQSSTEDTSVIVTPDWDSHAVSLLASLLGQDAIAVWHPMREGQPGELLGPNCAAWGGEFLPEFFLLPEGMTLGSVLAGFKRAA